MSIVILPLATRTFSTVDLYSSFANIGDIDGERSRGSGVELGRRGTVGIRPTCTKAAVLTWRWHRRPNDRVACINGATPTTIPQMIPLNDLGSQVSTRVDGYFTMTCDRQ